jgi:ethanolamine utilization microcompartment shell protein EutL
MRDTEYLIDLLAQATIEAPAENCVAVEQMILAREVETAVFQHPPSKTIFSALRIGNEARLSFACRIKEVAWPLLKTAVRFTVSASCDDKTIVLFDLKLDPRRRKSD